MQDANGSRFALVLGRADWGACRLVGGDAGERPRLASLWAQSAKSAAAPLAYDDDQQSLALARRTSRFRAGSADLAPDPSRRLGAAMDRHGNVYALVDGGRRITVRSAGSGATTAFWPPEPAAAAVPDPAAFGPAEPSAPAVPRTMAAMAVTTDGHLVVGLVPDAPGASGTSGLLVFDLLAGGPPLELVFPERWVLHPHDMAPRGAGVAVLDRVQRRVWLLGATLGMAGPLPRRPGAAPHFSANGEPGDDGAAPPADPWFDLAVTAKGGADPVAVEVLADGAVLVLDGAGRDGFALLGLYERGALVAQASAKAALDVVQDDEEAGFTLRGFDVALHAATFQQRQRAIVVSHEGNQAIAFDLDRRGGGLVLKADAGFLPLRRYGGQALVAGARAAAAGDTGLFYESLGRWLPLVEQRRPRHEPAGTLLTPAFDGADPGCTWHRVMLDGCIPAGCQVRVESRAADDADVLDDLPFFAEPLPAKRPDGSELPWLIEGPGSDRSGGHGTWELLLQRARGRWLQLRVTLEGNELATPRLAALRAWRPRFDYAQRYLPAVFREDAASADFLARFLANFEGQFTALEDRIAAATALFDVRSAPADTLDWLAGWLGLVLDPAFDDRRRRQLIRHAVQLFKYRGTTSALRLAVQLALSDCVPEADFELPAPSQTQPWGVRVVEAFLTRTLPPALLGETTFGDAPRAVVPGARWTLAEGAAGLQQRWERWAAAAAKDATGTRFGPLPPPGLESEWTSFCSATLGAVPSLAVEFQAAWTAFAARGQAPKLGAALPTRWPSDAEADGAARQAEWRRFLGSLHGRLARRVRRWQDFVARRHVRIADHRRRGGADWPAFDLLPVPTTLPTADPMLADWTLFETRLEPMAARAHAFSVLLPISGPQAEREALAQRIDLATRIVRLEKPAHTRFDVRPYWALFRIGQVRLGLDTLLGDGSREAGLAPELVLGAGHLGAARVALRPTLPADRLLLEC